MFSHQVISEKCSCIFKPDEVFDDLHDNVVLAERPPLFKSILWKLWHCLPVGHMMMSTVKYHDDGVTVGEWKVNKNQDVEM